MLRFIAFFTKAGHRSLWIHSTPPGNLPKIHSDPALSSTPRSSEWCLSFGISQQYLVYFSLLSHACHIPRSPHSPWLDLRNDIWGWVQIMLLLIVPLPQFSCSSLLGPNSLIRTLFSNTPSVCALPLMWVTKFHTHIKNCQNCGIVYFNLYIPGQPAGRQILDRMVASIPWI
jgi:hypothetical protein